MGISSITPVLGSPFIKLADKIFKNMNNNLNVKSRTVLRREYFLLQINDNLLLTNVNYRL